ncbi:MAG: methyltransferase domain-containing protein [Planctomycetales bacterium]|nr:methyltransferase domain-containing protein [Planctomycetales bacterium]
MLDLGSGGGKICYIASQIVGSSGCVIGVDMNDDMLVLARRHRPAVAAAIGWDNVEFRKGRIQDLALDLEAFERHLADQPVRSVDDWGRAQQFADAQRAASPLVADGSIDVIVSNCVLNLVRAEDRRRLFREMHRVLKRGGRAVISDIVSDEPVPAHLQNNADLWSGCISGAFEERDFFRAFEEAGFYGMHYEVFETEPWGTVEGIEFRSVTIVGYKGKEGPCLDHKQAVVYRGPWKAVIDDDGHTLRRGERMAVCEKTFGIYTRPPYAQQVIAVEPRQPVDPAFAQPFDCSRDAVRDPQVTKGAAPRLTQLPQGSCCGPSGCE